MIHSKRKTWVGRLHFIIFTLIKKCNYNSHEFLRSHKSERHHYWNRNFISFESNLLPLISVKNVEVKKLKTFVLISYSFFFFSPKEPGLVRPFFKGFFSILLDHNSNFFGPLFQQLETASAFLPLAKLLLKSMVIPWMQSAGSGPSKLQSVQDRTLSIAKTDTPDQLSHSTQCWLQNQFRKYSYANCLNEIWIMTSNNSSSIFIRAL